MTTLHRIAAALCGLCLFASFGAAAEKTDGPAFSEIRAQQLELREEVSEGNGIFQAMNEQERGIVVQRQDELLALIEGKDVVEDLPDADKVRAFNLLQEINALVNNIDDDRVICEYVRKTGSHRKTKRCATVAERRIQRETAQHAMQNTLDRFCSPMGGSCGG